MPRLFIALPAGDDVISFFKSQYEYLAGFKSCIKAVPPENYHITIKFLGECDNGMAQNIRNGFKNLNLNFNKLPVIIKGMGVFPHLKKATVIWSGLEFKGEIINDIFNKIEEFSRSSEIAREKRRFNPHLTLARVRRDMTLPPELRDHIQNNSETLYLESFFSRISLYESALGGKGPAYSELSSIPFLD
jgi:2'-5' RNA ligase